MYVLEPYFNSMKVVPADLLYKLPNYHREFLSGMLVHKTTILLAKDRILFF